MEYVFVVLFVWLVGWLFVVFVSVFVCDCMFVISSLYEMFVAHLKTNESGAKKQHIWISNYLPWNYLGDPPKIFRNASMKKNHKKKQKMKSDEI